MSRPLAPLLLLGLAALTGCARTERPDVLLVTIDTLRADHVGAYGHDRDTTPHLDRLAAEGALFEVAYAPVGSTTPSHATLFTGRHPLDHGVTANGMVLPEHVRTLAEELAERGWRTGAVVSALTASSRWGLGQGFQFIDERFHRASREGAAPSWRDPDHAVDAAISWLERQPPDGPPVFLWLHLFDPHSPWEPPPEHAALFPPRGRAAHAEARAAYEGEVHYSDAELGRLLAAFDARPGEALVVATSDHGEGLWDHGWATHSRTTHEEELRVPLILRWRERVPAGLRLARPQAELGDVPATISGLLRLGPSGWRPGLDLSPALRGELSGEASRELLLMRPLHPAGRGPRDQTGPGLGLRSGSWKLFCAPLEDRIDLYELGSDPGERHDLSAEQPEQARGLARRAFERAQQVRRSDTAPIDSTLTTDELERLRSLGYLR